ncbi:MAG: hypothetical protein MJK08_06765 [Campylobacterales bacterium]|nr:hypothetical protein [Campylobacterales bacterium]
MKIRKNLTLYISFTILVFFAVFIYFTYETKTLDMNIDKELQLKANKSYLENKISLAIKSESFDDVLMYKDLSSYLNIAIDKKLEKEIKENNTFFSKTIRNTKSFSLGFIEGEANDSSSLAGSIVSDMTLYGDLRDISKEGNKLIHNEDYDEIVLGISIIGLALTATTYVSLGSAAPLKVGTSILKIAKKTNKLSKPFIKYISKTIRKTINIKQIKKIDFSSFSKIKSSFKNVSKNIDVSHSKELFSKINKIKKNTSSLDTIYLLKYIDKEKDLSKVMKISKTYGKNTKAVFKVLGKRILKAGKSVIKYTYLLMAQLISFIISAFVFVFAIVSKIKFILSLRKKYFFR